MKDLKNKHIVVAGAARSGVAAAVLLKNRGGRLFVSDAGRIQPEMEDRLLTEKIPFEQHGHTELAEKGDFLVISPGIPTESAIAQTYLESGRAVYSELEAASWFNPGKTVAVTGSNGKTTVVNWLGHIWQTAGKPARVAGNIGTAFSDIVSAAPDGSDVLLEVSSFQLDHIDTFHPEVSMILNITPDHLDRYGQSFERYAASKFRITENQDQNDWFIFDADDAKLRNFSEDLKQKKSSPKQLSFSLKQSVDQGLYLQDGKLILRFNNNEETLMDINELSLPGNHNLKNGMAAALAARALEIESPQIRESLKTFEGVEHRLEPVRTVNGVRYINDSKATNINAVWYALDSFDTPTVLILGGRDKGNDYNELKSQLQKKVHTIIAIGEAREAIKSQLDDVVPYLLEADSMKEAVKIAAEKAKRGELVLLSPACSSFDMFKNYEDRGRQFKQAVLDL